MDEFEILVEMVEELIKIIILIIMCKDYGFYWSVELVMIDTISNLSESWSFALRGFLPYETSIQLLSNGYHVTKVI